MKKTWSTTPQRGKPKGNNLVVISGRALSAKLETVNAGVASWRVTQMRLARIQQLQSQAVFVHEELAKEWRTVRKEMIGGAQVEIGPIRAFLKYSIRLVRTRGSSLRQARTYTTLVVR